MKYVSTKPDGGVQITIGAPKEKIEQVLGKSLTQRQYEALIKKTCRGKNPSKIADSKIPKDREFRDAWVRYSKGITHDLNKAKDIQLERIRKKRANKFKQLDEEYLIALSLNQDVSTIQVKQKELRDITETVKNKTYNSIDELKADFPDQLKDD